MESLLFSTEKKLLKDGVKEKLQQIQKIYLLCHDAESREELEGLLDINTYNDKRWHVIGNNVFNITRYRFREGEAVLLMPRWWEGYSPESLATIRGRFIGVLEYATPYMETLCFETALLVWLPFRN